MDASTAKGCAYCGSKRHGTLTCFMGKIPKGHYQINGRNVLIKPKPTIPVSEVSRLLVNARKVIMKCKEFDNSDRYIVDTCFRAIRSKLELRRRGRK